MNYVSFWEHINPYTEGEEEIKFVLHWAGLGKQVKLSVKEMLHTNAWWTELAAGVMTDEGKSLEAKNQTNQDSKNSFFRSVLSILCYQLGYEEFIHDTWTVWEMCSNWNSFLHFPDTNFMT